MNNDIYTSPSSKIDKVGVEPNKVVTSILYGGLAALLSLIVLGLMISIIGREIFGYIDSVFDSLDRRTWATSPYFIPVTCGKWFISLFIGGVVSAMRSTAKWLTSTLGLGVLFLVIWLPMQFFNSSGISSLQMYIGFLATPSPLLAGALIHILKPNKSSKKDAQKSRASS